ncbi:MAG: hypothetical protein HKP29_06150, partial [Silicimonas sp.]|nr:hypothetical protein [Silicimonas sp.]
MDKNVEADVDETVADAGPAKAARPRVRRREIGFSTMASLTLSAAIFTFLFLMLSGRAVPIPEVIRDRIEATVNARLGAERVALGGMALIIGRDGIPRVSLTNIKLGNAADGAVAVLNNLGARLSPGRLLQGDLAASELLLSGAQITVRRTASGAFAFGGAGGDESMAQSVPQILDLVDAIFDSSALSSLRTVEAGGIVLSLEDARSGRIWQATNASLVMRRADRATTLSLASDVFNGTDNVAEVQLSVARNLTTSGVSLGATVNRMPAADIALQAPVLSWLGVLDAGLSGSVRAEIGADGRLTSLAGTLDIEAGALRPLPDVPPVEFSSARTYFTFDPSRQRLDFSELAVVSEQGRMTATGHTYLAELNGPWPGAFLGQFDIGTVEYDGEGIFPEPFALSGLKADMRLRLDPFTVELGQIAVDQDEARIRASGRITAEADGWHVAVDAGSPAIQSERVLRYWPLVVSPVTRGWLAKNLKAGELRDVSAGIRYQTGSKPDAILSFEFDDGEVSFLRAMPPLTEAAGRATLFERRFTLYLDEGRVDAGPPGVLNAAGSIFSVPDTRPKPAMGEIHLVAEGPLQAALTVLNEPPLRIMDRADRAPDLARADARAEARIVLPLKDGIDGDEVEYSVSAVLRDVSSEAIAESRLLTADRLEFAATNREVRLVGSVRLDGVPARASWRQPLGAAAAAGGWVEGTIALSDETMEAFDIPLPAGLIGGRGTGRYRLDLPGDGPPQLRLTSDLTGMALALDALGWRKAAGTAGEFVLTAELGEIPVVEGLLLNAPGLSLSGTLDLDDDGAFAGAVFENVQVGDWLDGRVELKARGAGRAPAIRISDGRMDLRRLPDGGAG